MVKSLMRQLKRQAHQKVRKAPALTLNEFIQTEKQVKSRTMINIMRIAWITAARAGNMHKLIFRKATNQGWRFTWIDHKGFAAMGPVDVFVPKKCIPETFEMKVKPDQPVCTESENNEFNALMKKHLAGRTHSIRRSSAQHMRFNLNMSPEEIITITKHKSVATLEGYLASNH